MRRPAPVRAHRARRAAITVEALEHAEHARQALSPCLRSALARSTWPASLTLGSLASYVEERVAPTSSGKRVTFAARIRGRVEGLCVLEPLAWDSALYSLRMARLEGFLASRVPSLQASIASALLGAVSWEWRAKRLDHVAARVNYGDVGWSGALETRGFRAVDTTVTLTREIARTIQSHALRLTRVAREDDIPALQRVAANAFVNGRVDHDPRLASRTNRELYRQWVANACRGRSDLALVYPRQGRPVGFVCCNLDRKAARWLHTTLGFVDLLAVAPRMQGRGIGRTLLRAALEWFSARVRLVEIRTQLENLVSLSLYQEEGFRIMSQGIALPSGHMFHGWVGSSR